ncbi:MAG: hypothetical protein D6734_03880 [Candidatus Schekmanbacteria bacterium]|nr:MAG: hypothetical protein D6734_03880 [Candidatus Schekmanbacteria bacterium]
MFDYFRKNTKKFQPILWIIIIAFIAFYGVMSNNNREGLPVAKVNGVNISYREYRNELAQTEDQIRSILKENADEYLKRINLKEMVLNRLIERELLRQAAQEMNVKPSDYDLLEKLKSYDVFKDKSGKLDKRQMISILRRNRIDPKDFIESQRQEVSIDMARRMLEDCADVTEEEMWERFVEENEKVEAEYAFFPLEYFFEDVKVTDEKLKEYFSKNQDQYNVEDSAEVEYALVNIRDFLNKVKISDDDVKKYYDENQEKFKVDEEQVKARHILFRIKPGQSSDEIEIIKKKAEKVLKEAKSGKDFVALAQMYSDEPLSTTRGGDLGFFGRGEMDPAFEKAAFALKEGEISGLVRSSYGFHIIKVEKKLAPGEVKPFEYVKDEIKIRLQKEKAKEQALVRANEIKKNFDSDSAKIEKIKKKIFRNEMIDGVINAGKFFNTAYSLEEGKISDPVNVGQKIAVIKTLKKAAAHKGTFEEVRDEVERDYKKENAFGIAEKKVSSIAKEINKGKSLKSLIKDKRIVVKSTGNILRREVPSDIKDREKFTALIFSLKKEKPAGFVISQNGAYVAYLKNKSQLSREEFESKKQTIYSKIIDERKNIVFSEVIASLRKNGDIEISESIL